MSSSGRRFNLHLHSSVSEKQDKGQGRYDSHSSSGSTSPEAMSAKGHKHYRSQPHVDTPHPVLQHTSSNDSTSSSGSTGSYMDVHKYNHTAQHLAEQIPNPFAITSHAIQDHITELHYGHIARAAKKEAGRSSSHSSHPWNQGVSHIRSDSIPEYVEESAEDKERDRELWAQELRKREKARKLTASTQAISDACEQK